MSSTNGHGPKRAILYARVSTDEQARSGYSLAQQLEALREYAIREGYEVIEEVEDRGQSGASLERPGMDRVRDLVAAGGVSVVLAQDRDRFSREPAYAYLLKREFEEHGCKLRALNARGDESPEGELMDGVFDQFAKFERAKTTERSRRGKIRKAREGKIVPTHTADFGFKFNAKRDGYEVNQEAMSVVRRVFYLVGVEGLPLHHVKKLFDREGVALPPAKLPKNRSPRPRHWSKQFIRACILDDVYRPLTFQEIKELVTPEVAARLDPEKRYGVWWFNVHRTITKQVAETGSNGRRYRQRSTTIIKPKEEWVAVPVPDGGIPREWVDAARAAIKNNRVPSSAGHRFWELSGGIFRCEGCGRRMSTNTVNVARRHHYYRCPTRQNDGKDACPMSKTFRADKAEPLVWEFLSDFLKDPEQLCADLERMIELEREGMRGDPEQETRVWLEKLSEVDRKRSNFQDQAAEGLMTLGELRAKLADLEETHATIEHELKVLQSRQEHLESLERDKDALLKSYAKMAPEALDSLSGEERHQLYKMLRLKVVANLEGTLEVSGFFGSGVGSWETSSTPSSSTMSSSMPATSTSSEIRWRA